MAPPRKPRAAARKEPAAGKAASGTSGSSGSAAKSGRSAKARPRKVAPAGQEPAARGADDMTDAERAEAAAEFARMLVASGRAARRDRSGKLPPGATHEIVGTDDAGRPILRRRRFSA